MFVCRDKFVFKANRFFVALAFGSAYFYNFAHVTKYLSYLILVKKVKVLYKIQLSRLCMYVCTVYACFSGLSGRITVPLLPYMQFTNGLFL